MIADDLTLIGIAGHCRCMPPKSTSTTLSIIEDIIPPNPEASFGEHRLARISRRRVDVRVETGDGSRSVNGQIRKMSLLGTGLSVNYQRSGPGLLARVGGCRSAPRRCRDHASRWAKTPMAHLLVERVLLDPMKAAVHQQQLVAIQKF